MTPLLYLLYVIQAQDVSASSPEILYQGKEKDKSVAQAMWEACQLVFVVLFVFFNKCFLCYTC